MQLPTQKNFINGEYVNSQSGETFSTRFPATEEKICDVELALENEVELAVNSAIEAQKVWALTSGQEKARILNAAARILRQRNDELAKLEVYDTGKPIQEALEVDVHSGADAIEYFAGLAPAIKGDHYQIGSNFAYTRREPLGVVAGIGAWNYPIQIACWKAAPALAAGNAMIFKPSEETPLTALKLAEIFIEAGLPKGLFNVVQGDARTGQLLVSHPKIKKISLTGEVGTGKKVMAAAANTLKHVTLELGGKSPLIIFEDANLDNAVKAAFNANFYTQGEICSNGTRVFVHESVHQQFVEKMTELTKSLKVGDPLDPKTQVGALIHSAHADKVASYIEKGKAEGATLVCGGERDGNFITPAIFTNCQDDMTIVKEEIFGPVMCVLAFKDEQEVITRANNTEFGLAAGVFTNDLNRAHRVIGQVEAGTCWINTYNITPIEVPFGGYKQSGLGRENSEHALDHYTQLKTVYVETGDL
jgi:betaine-aldehyde dehydrogenase